jgi:hypothetical protein
MPIGIGHRLGSASAAIALQILPPAPNQLKLTKVSKNKGDDNGGSQ